MHFTPLIYDNLDYAWSFSAELSPEGLIGIAGSVLRYALHFLALLSSSNFLLSGRIFQVPRLGTKLKQDSIPLSYTPRKFITHPGNHYFYMIEGDHRVLGEVAADAKLQELVCNKLINCIRVSCLAYLLSSSVDREKRLILKWSIFQLKYLVDPRRQQGLGDHPSESSTPLKRKLLQLFLWKIMKQHSHLQSFRSQLVAANSILLLVRQRILCFLLDHVPLVTYGRTSLQMTVLPLALLAFQGRLVAGVGKALRIYDIGKKKLLRKVENKVRLFWFK
jgi:splicing factor 3B subunit 3